MDEAVGHSRRELAPRSGWRAARAAWWLMPWACVFLLTRALANAADQALGDTLPKSSAMRVLSDEAIERSPSRWVTISSATAQSSPWSETCLIPMDRAAADVLEVSSIDFDAAVAGLCSTRLATDG